MGTFSVSTALEIAKILIACGIADESDLMSITEQLMCGQFLPRSIYGQNKDEERQSKEKVLV